MSKYFKKFNTHEEYEAYITSESKILPNVSICVINEHVHYNPRTKSVTGVTLNKSSLSLKVGTSETLVATVLPSTASNKQVTWTSSNSSVATVDDTGKVTAVSGGNATITVRTVDGGFTAQCAASVAVGVTGVTLNKSSLSLSQGASETLVATVLPSTASNKQVTWTSSNSSVATVDSNGKVTAVSGGNATITVRTNDGGFTAQCATSVAVGVTGVTLNKSSLSLKVGTSETLVATVLPTSATNKNVTWTSSNNSVATVDNTGKVTAVSGGNATITVRTVDGGFTAQCATSVAVGVTGVTLNKSSLSLSQGASETLIATVSPTSATNKSVTWSSSNSSVATVDDTGKVTAVSGGNATITVRTVDGGFTAQCAASVAVGVTGVTLNKSSLSLSQGASETLVATVLPSTASNKQVTWTSSNSSVATVDSNGKVTAVSGGNATITVRTNDGGFTAQCATSVAVGVTGVTLNKSSLSLDQGTSETLIATVSPTSAMNKSVTWSSSNSSVATVDSTGKVTAVSGGNATIIVRTNDGGFTAQCAISVQNASYLITKYNVTSTTVPTIIGTSRSTNNFAKIEIDGVPQPSVVSAYTFNSLGEHYVRYKLVGTQVGTSALSRCSSLISVEMTDNVTSIEIGAFSHCSSLTSVTIGSGVTSIRSNAFYNCPSLISITIPNSVTSIGNSVFGSCSGLTSMLVESGNENYDSRNNCNAIIETASNTLIAGCQNTVIPSSVTSIGDYAFWVCSTLASITIPNSVTSIGQQAFDSCSSLTSVTIPDSVTSVGGYVFNECSSLTSVNIGNSITRIGYQMFADCSSLTSITIPNSVTSIEERAFRNCSSLTSVTITSSVTSIGEAAFYDCSSLTSINIPSGVTNIEYQTFYNCSSLASVTIPSGVTSIRSNAFYGCSSLTSIISNATSAPLIGNTTFQEVKNGGTLTVPSGSSGYDTWMQNDNYYLGLYGWRLVEQ